MIETTVIAIVTTIVGPAIVLYLKHVLEKRRSRGDMVHDAAKLGEHVSGRLDYLRDIYDADRIWISQFHNGGHFYPTGKSIAKFSIFYETVSLNTTSIQTSFHNIPVALFSKSINHLLENDAITIYDFKDETVATYGLKYIAEDSGTKSQYLFAIKTFEGRFIGVLGVDFTKRKHKLTDEQLTELQVSAATIGGVLINHLKA
jgi:hypothetical protein